MKALYIVVLFALIGITPLAGQGSGTTYNPVAQTALDFLNITMDARSAGMGDMGVATSSDAYSHQHNPSKYLFGTNGAGLSLSYSPWLRNIVKDMNLYSLGGYYIIDSLQAVSSSFRFFEMGDMKFFNEVGEPTMADKNSYQLALDAAYSRKLSEYFAASIGFRYVLSDIYPKDGGYKKGSGFSADLGVYFNKPIELGSLPSKITAGAVLSDIGTKVTYRENQRGYFMPMQFKLGGALTSKLDKENSLMFGLEFGRSLVPTKADKLDDSSLSGMLSSISEGDIQSINWSVGAEYGFKNLLFGRMGYSDEGNRFGARQYMTFGASLRYKKADFDFAYLTTVGSKNHAMANTLRLSVAFNFSR